MPKVIKLSTRTAARQWLKSILEKKQHERQLWLLYFTNPDCSACQTFNKTFHQVITKLDKQSNLNMGFVTAEAGAIDYLADKLQIQIDVTPTVVLLKPEVERRGYRFEKADAVAHEGQFILSLKDAYRGLKPSLDYRYYVGQKHDPVNVSNCEALQQLKNAGIVTRSLATENQTQHMVLMIGETRLQGEHACELLKKLLPAVCRR